MEAEKFKTQIREARIKSTRTVSYRRYGVPAVIIEGKWLEKVYKWKIGDQISVEYLPQEIRLKKIRKTKQVEYQLATDSVLPK